MDQNYNININVKETGADAVRKKIKDLRDSVRPLTDEEIKLTIKTEGFDAAEKKIKDNADQAKKLDKIIAGIQPTAENAMRGLVRDLKSAESAGKAAEAAMANVGKATNETGSKIKANSGVWRESFVLLHESLTGNFSRIPGSALVLFGERTDILSNSLKKLAGLGPIVGGALGIMAIAAGVVTAGFIIGARESTALANSLILTGNYAGKTASQLGDMAKAMAQSTGGSQHFAAQVLTELVSTGKVAGDQLQIVGAAAISMERFGGTAVKKFADEIVKLADDPVKASKKLNEHFHYLTLAIYEQIEALEKQGKHHEAVALAQETLAKATQEMAAKIQASQGWIAQGWNAVASAAKKAWDAMLNIGRTATNTDQLAKLRQSLALAENDQKTYGPNDSPYEKTRRENRVAALKMQILATEDLGRATAFAAKEEGKRAADQDGAIAASERLEHQINRVATKKEKKEKELREAQRDFDLVRKADPNSPKLDKEQAVYDDIIAKYADKSKAASHDKHRAEIIDIDTLFKDLANAYKIGQDKIKIQLNKGLIDEDEAASQDLQLHLKEIRAREKLVEQKIDLTKKEKGNIKAELAKWNEQLTLLKSQEDVIQSEFDKKESDRIAKHQLGILRIEEFNRREIASIEAVSLARQKNINKEFNKLSMGPVEAAHTDARENLAVSLTQDRTKLEENYEKERAHIKEQYKGNEGLERLIDSIYGKEAARLKLTQDETRAVQDQEKGFAKIAAWESNWVNGARKAFKIYIEEVGNVAKQTEELFKKAFKSTEDALVNLVKTGKFDIKGLLASILEDISRITIRQALVKALPTSLTGSTESAGQIAGAAAITTAATALATAGATAGSEVAFGGEIVQAASIQLGISAEQLRIAAIQLAAANGGGGGGGILGGIFGGGAAAGGAAAAVSDAEVVAMFVANGAAFSGGNIIPFASGGVIGSPTTFPMSGGRTGLMGEAGPEAVMPLTRGRDGRLGVQTTGPKADSKGDNNFNFGDIIIQGGQTNEQTAAAMRKEMMRTMKDIADSRILEQMRPGGTMRV